MSFKQYLSTIWRSIVDILVTIDCLANVLCFGQYRETLSERWGKMLMRHSKGWAPQYFCRELDKIDKNHCVDEAKDPYDLWKNKE